jgi:hypothetical protein
VRYTINRIIIPNLLLMRGVSSVIKCFPTSLATPDVDTVVTKVIGTVFPELALSITGSSRRVCAVTVSGDQFCDGALSSLRSQRVRARGRVRVRYGWDGWQRRPSDCEPRQARLGSGWSGPWTSFPYRWSGHDSCHARQADAANVTYVWPVLHVCPAPYASVRMPDRANVQNRAACL